MKKEIDFVFPYGNVTYPAHVTYKKMRRVVFRIKAGTIMISSPNHLSHVMLLKHLNLMMPKLLVLLNRELPQTDQYQYILGYKKTIILGSKTFHIDDQEVYAKDKEALERHIRKWGKAYLTERVRHYEALMGVAQPYNVFLRSMESRYGSNSRGTHRLTFARKLLHYSPEIIDAIVVHELAHYFHFDHSKKFYQTIYTFCPTYKVEHAKLRKGMYR